jgi:FAD/FMN-containing dehydrogenase
MLDRVECGLRRRDTKKYFLAQIKQVSPVLYRLLRCQKLKLIEQFMIKGIELKGELDKVAKKYNVTVPCFGHTGDGNVHTNVMVDGSDPKQVEIGHQAIEEIFKATVALGGTLSGEHGIGIAKAPFMHLAFSDAEMELFRSIKLAFDPNNILNPHKMGL